MRKVGDVFATAIHLPQRSSTERTGCRHIVVALGFMSSNNHIGMLEKFPFALIILFKYTNSVLNFPIQS